jgi:hypothetical protein
MRRFAAIALCVVTAALPAAAVSWSAATSQAFKPLGCCSNAR